MALNPSPISISRLSPIAVPFSFNFIRSFNNLVSLKRPLYSHKIGYSYFLIRHYYYFLY